jgi:ribonuclease HI
MENIVIYTDGGCRGNPGVGGWGVWLRYKDHDKKLKGSELNTTNNKMELTAAIKALEAVKASSLKDFLEVVKASLVGPNQSFEGAVAELAAGKCGGKLRSPVRAT